MPARNYDQGQTGLGDVEDQPGFLVRGLEEVARPTEGGLAVKAGDDTRDVGRARRCVRREAVETVSEAGRDRTGERPRGALVRTDDIHNWRPPANRASLDRGGDRRRGRCELDGNRGGIEAAQGKVVGIGAVSSTPRRYHATRGSRRSARVAAPPG